VNLDESRKDANEFLKKMPAKFDIAFDKSGKTAEAYNLKAMPSSFLIDRNGNLVHKSLGYRAEEKKILEKKIKQLVDKSVVATR
ncbi:MAG: TlpA disulfide reductase family protein, partial [Gammaproteobacteria bacterium]